MLYLKPSCSCLRPRTGRHIESILGIRGGLWDPDRSWLGKGRRCPRRGSKTFFQALSQLVFSAVPILQAARRGVLLKNTTVPSCPGFPWTLAEKEGRPCIPTGSRDATALLGSAARHRSFRVPLQGRHQPLCMPPGALVSPPHPGFEEWLTAFYSNRYFQFVYTDDLLAPQLLHTFSLLSFFFPPVAINYAFRATAYLLWMYLKLCYVFDKKLPDCLCSVGSVAWLYCGKN